MIQHRVPSEEILLEKIGRNTRYAMTNSAISHMSEIARAFEAAPCDEEEILYSPEGAMREAMKMEVEALA